MIEVKFDLNIRDITEKLEKLEKNIQKKMARKAMRAGAKVLVDEAKARVPVKSGNLRKSIGIVSKTKKGDVLMFVGPRSVKESKAHIKKTVGYKKDGTPKYAYTTQKGKFVADGFYGRFVELGHILREKNKGKKGKVVGHVPPHPFLRPTFEAKGKEAIDVFRKKLRELINEYRG